MQSKTQKARWATLLLLALLCGFVIEGCQKESPPPSNNTAPQKPSGKDGVD